LLLISFTTNSMGCGRSAMVSITGSKGSHASFRFSGRPPLR
jgi:hypothetical protein